MSRKPQVAVAISAFRSDQEVIGLVDQITRERWPVQRIIVVDSMGSGAIAEHLQRRQLEETVLYFNAESNLGSAGNLQKRLELAAGLDMDFVLALNHDACASRRVLDDMMAWAGLEHVGALYPIRYRVGKARFDLTGEHDSGFRVRGPRERPQRPLIPVQWGSSNGALYSTAPVRESGLKPDGTLWMGWEDYLYGLLLSRHGYKQWVVTAAEMPDPYEYRSVKLGPHTLILADKPFWCLYYSVRNRLSIDMHRVPSIRRAARSIAWAGMMLVHVVTAPRRSTSAALGAYSHGLIDGLRNRGGKWSLP